MQGAGEQDNMYGAYGGYGGGYSGYSPPAGLPSPPMAAPSPQQMSNMSKKPHMMADNRAPNQQQQQHSQQVGAVFYLLEKLGIADTYRGNSIPPLQELSAFRTL